MNPTDLVRPRLDLAAARYLAALEQDDFAAMADVWRLALEDPKLEGVLHEVHAGLIEEQAGEAADAATAACLTAAVETHPAQPPKLSALRNWPAPSPSVMWLRNCSATLRTGCQPRPTC